jgi:hypothetical protein
VVEFHLCMVHSWNITRYKLTIIRITNISWDNVLQFFQTSRRSSGMLLSSTSGDVCDVSDDGSELRTRNQVWMSYATKSNN